MVANCNDGFVGQPYTQCRNGTFQPVVGSCAAITATTGICVGAPATVPTGTSGWDCYNPRYGEVCYAQCRDPNVGKYMSICTAGKFVAVSSTNTTCHAPKAVGCDTPPTFNTGTNATDFPYW